MKRILREAAVGFASGVLATVPMTAEFRAAWRAGLIDEIPPHKAIRSVTSRLSEPRLSFVSAIAHLLVGGVAGSFYGVLVPRRMQSLASGTLFGLAVWAIGYELLMPAATDIAPAHRDQRSRAATIVIAHVIFGAALAGSVALSHRLPVGTGRRQKLTTERLHFDWL
jgi:ABC-type xylose transport system permease subunit